jgi:RNA methyltransferase, TrmH family
MDSEIIRSRQNTLIKHARAVRDRRASEGQIFIEGLRLSEEALRSRLVVQDVLYTEKIEHEERGAQLLRDLKDAGGRLSPVSQEVLAYVSDTRTPQGIVLLASRPHTESSTLLSRAINQVTTSERGELSFGTNLPLLVIIHGINNPANAGAILRTAEAAGVNGLVSTAGTTDLFSAKALRGAMGSSFRLPLWTGATIVEVIDWCRHNGIRLIGASLDATKAHTEAPWKQSCALVIGSEAAGLNASETSMLDDVIRIPMRPPVESLNAAVASGIILYEAARQRSVEPGMGILKW